MSPTKSAMAQLDHAIDRVAWDQQDPLVGAHTTPLEAYIAPTLEVDDLAELGIAGGRRWYAYRAHELRTDRHLTGMERGGLLPRGSVILHSTQVIEKHVVTEDNPDPWKPGERMQIPRQVIDVWQLATILPKGSFSEAQARTTSNAARAAQREENQAERDAKREIGRRRAKLYAAWLGGEHVDGLPD